MTNQIIAVLRDAKEYLFEKGWHKGNYGTVDGPVCLAGACLMVQFGNFDQSSPLDDKITDTLNAACKEEGFTHIACFNDAEETSFDDVINVIDKAIKKLEGDV